MKRIMALSVALICFLTACSSKPTGISENVYDIAKQMIEVADSYYDFDIDIKSAKEKSERLYQRFGNSSTTSDEIVIECAHILMLAIEQAEHYNGEAKTDNDVLEKRNELAKQLNISKK